jgi:lipase
LQDLESPCHLVGHSYGASQALRAATIAPEKVKTLTLIDPAAVSLLNKPEALSPNYLNFRALGTLVRQNVTSGNYANAARHFFGFWQGLDDTYEHITVPHKNQLFSMPKINCEFEDLTRDNYSDAELARLRMPVSLIKGERTKPIIHDVVGELESRLPQASVHVVQGAGHLLPFTHKEQVFELIALQITASQQQIENEPVRAA